MLDRVVYVPNVISPEACGELAAECERGAWSTGFIGDGKGGVTTNPEIRFSSVQWLSAGHWLYEILKSQVHHRNLQTFGFELGAHEAIQLSKYVASGHYRWHCDQLWPPYHDDNHPEWKGQIRKLSAALQLSAPGSYLGGDTLFQESYGRILNGSEASEDWRAQGSLLVFPSTLQHCVTPVRAGTRLSAVLWTLGPVWK